MMPVLVVLLILLSVLCVVLWSSARARGRGGAGPGGAPQGAPVWPAATSEELRRALEAAEGHRRRADALAAELRAAGQQAEAAVRDLAAARRIAAEAARQHEAAAAQLGHATARQAAAEREQAAAEQRQAAAERDRTAAEERGAAAEREKQAAEQRSAEAEQQRRQLAARTGDLAADLARERDELEAARRQLAKEQTQREEAEQQAAEHLMRRGGHPGVRAEVNRIRRLYNKDVSPHLPPEFGDVLPTIPQQPSLSPDAVADSVVDGANLGAVVVRAASACGERHRTARQHRRDAILLRTATGQGRRMLLGSVAAGVPDGAWSQSAAAHACQSLADTVERYADELGPALEGPADAPVPERAAAVLRLALHDVGRAILAQGGIRGWLPDDGSGDDHAVSASLAALLSPLDDSASRRHLAFAVGDGAVLRLRQGRWSPVLPLPATQAEAVPLPGNRLVRCEPVRTEPGDLLAVCPRPMAELLLNEETGRWFAELWGAGQPTLTYFLMQVNSSLPAVPATLEDRSVICLWDFGYTDAALDSRFVGGGESR